MRLDSALLASALIAFTFSARAQDATEAKDLEPMPQETPTTDEDPALGTDQSDFNVQIPDDVAPTPIPSQSEVPTAEVSPEPPQSQEIQEDYSVSQPVRWGKTMVAISIAQIDFPCIYGYRDLYGAAPLAPTFSSEMMLLRSYFSVGVRVQAALFTDRGHPTRNATVPEDPCQDVTLVAESREKTELTIVPIGASLWLRFPLWRGKPIYVGAGAGIDYAFHTETRLDKETSATSAGDEQGKPFVNQGSKNLITFGGEIGVRLTNEEDNTGLGTDALSMKAIYLNGFYHLRQKLGQKGIDLSGTSMGVGFNFELF